MNRNNFLSILVMGISSVVILTSGIVITTVRSNPSKLWILMAPLFKSTSKTHKPMFVISLRTTHRSPTANQFKASGSASETIFPTKRSAMGTEFQCTHSIPMPNSFYFESGILMTKKNRHNRNCKTTLNTC